MSTNYQQGAPRAPKKPVINKWEGEGIVHPRSGNDQDEITLYRFTSGRGGAIHISVECRDASGADANGNPKTTTVYVPVNVMTNKSITEAQLAGLRAGTRVHVVGKLQLESYTSKKDGTKKSSLVVNAFVFEILAPPQPEQAMGYQGGYYPPQGSYAAPQGYIPPQGYQPGYGPGVQQPAPQGYMPPQGYQQPGYMQAAGTPLPPNYQAPGYGPGYNQQGQQGYIPPATAPQGGNPVPPYYQAPGYAPAGQQPPAAPIPPDDDMPPGEPIHV